jgi:hypothetical protein
VSVDALQCFVLGPRHAFTPLGPQRFRRPLPADSVGKKYHQERAHYRIVFQSKPRLLIESRFCAATIQEIRKV